MNSAGTTIPFNNGQWHHLVLTDDATNINLYLDGVVTLGGIPNSSYAPNYWDPLEIDTGKGYTRDASDACMDEFAIYPSALSATSDLLSTTIPPALNLAHVGEVPYQNFGFER